MSSYTDISGCSGNRKRASPTNCQNRLKSQSTRYSHYPLPLHHVHTAQSLASLLFYDFSLSQNHQQNPEQPQKAMIHCNVNHNIGVNMTQKYKLLSTQRYAIRVHIIRVVNTSKFSPIRFWRNPLVQNDFRKNL